ncbi:hypothetical protein NPIL_548541 [Nephila pilipes]|uniref:Uncharacterized protein n=1 Tax=Nephila pilipes TaxID=299642 RepID=A0A8X6PDW9_NEPPI|nr:hypothetical protein NPIL_548541 [Nephila pilipes]
MRIDPTHENPKNTFKNQSNPQKLSYSILKNSEKIKRTNALFLRFVKEPGRCLQRGGEMEKFCAKRCIFGGSLLDEFRFSD